MSFLGAYNEKYKYPTYGREHRVQIDDIFLKPQYKVDGLEPDVADANLLDRDIDDIGRKLGAFQAEIDAHISRGMSPEQMVSNDELIGNRVNVVGADDSASTVEPEVRRIFGEYQTAAFLDALSDSDDGSDDDSSIDDDIAGFNGGEDDMQSDITGMEKNYRGITYYEVDNTKQYIFEPSSDIVSETVNETANEVANETIGEVVSEFAEPVAEVIIAAAELAIGAGDFNWDDLLE